MYQFAYSELCEEPPSQEAPPKSRRLSHAMELIEAVEAARCGSPEWLGVLSDFRRVWLTIVEDLPSGGHGAVGFEPQMRRLADSVLQEIERCRFHKHERDVHAWRGMWPQ